MAELWFFRQGPSQSRILRKHEFSNVNFKLQLFYGWIFNLWTDYGCFYLDCYFFLINLILLKRDVHTRDFTRWESEKMLRVIDIWIKYVYDKLHKCIYVYSFEISTMDEKFICIYVYTMRCEKYSSSLSILIYHVVNFLKFAILEWLFNKQK